ncbi:T9SS type A sorting domain-containing protein [Epilithonimonas pallida]|uniref:Por secretion system C-terminal sorting domain-containing protein n=1 Tax=Epilithonimonas pallida TaxID=373671 RepID=A0ABY1R5H3_9FLAO|nr:T9SS type A sorting domain-containing protein [Epilithonimonas pallida]SMP96275.1 Por secretion system C-terminal sorting domain-containing protein [Epilithonimonas pallida]
MIRKLFIIKLILFNSIAFSQVLTYVGNSALVTVQSQTLVYNGGGLQTAGTAIVNNSGNIMINAASTDQLNIASTSNVNLKFNGATSYGQLYIAGIPQTNITGKVNKEYRADANSGSTAKQQLALPFYNYPISDLVANLANSPGNTGGSYLNVTNGANNSAGRFNPSSVFRWNNARARFDQIAAASSALSTTYVGTPLDYYIIPRRNSSGTVVWDAAAASVVTTFAGTPVSDVSGNQSYSLTGASSGISFGYNGSATNYYGERYYSYLDDPFQSKTGNAGGWDASYGKNLYQVANPFLTNIDLRYIGQSESTNSDGNAIPNLQGIAYYTSGLTWTRGSGTGYPTENTSGSANGTAGRTVVMVASSGVFQAGDISGNRLVIKPMGEFMVKLSADNGNNAASAINYTLLRRFASTSRDNTTQTTNPTSKIFDDADIPTDKIVKQVAVIMYDTDSLEIGRTYYAISPSAVTGNSPGNTSLQAYNGDNAFVYTKEETLTGGEDINLSGKLYINEANEVAYKSKEIPLYISDVGTPYYLKFEVYEKGNRVPEGLSDGNSFYLKNSQGQFIKIVDGDSLSMSGAKVLGLYYELPEGATLGTGNVNNSQTIIAKKDSQWVVRFAKNWNKATVEVYSATGQLLNTKSQISTGSDYTVPLNYQAKSMFLVRAISDKGEVVTKKIVN